MMSAPQESDLIEKIANLQLMSCYYAEASRILVAEGPPPTLTDAAVSLQEAAHLLGYASRQALQVTQERT